MTIRIVNILLVCLLLVSVAGCLTPPQVHPQKDYSDFAKCLKDKGVVMYGAGWCGHCNNVKQRFGEAFKFMAYQECDANFGGNPAACEKAGVMYFPAFDFGDGKLQYGELEFSVLSDRTGCPLP